MALVNADYEFIYIDVGKNGRLSDAGIIEYTEFYRRLLEGSLNLPDNNETTENLNFVFISDEAFALHKNLLKPFPQQALNHQRRIFNYRLSRARNVVENAFGLITSVFRVLQTAINMKIENIRYVVLAICVLHNYLRKHSSAYVTATTFDRENTVTCTTDEGDWRQQSCQTTPLKQNPVRNVSFEAKENRENYLKYFADKGKVSWQEEMVRKGKA